MARADRSRAQLVTGLITTTIFEATGLFAGAALVALSRSLALSFLGFVGLLVWFIALWAENYSVAELTYPRFGLSQPLSILVMSVAEFITWTIWLVVLLQTDLHWVVLLLILAILTQIHHAVQFCFFFPDARMAAGLRNPLLWLASGIEAVAGQGLITQIISTDQFTYSDALPLLLGLLVLFTVEHLVSGQVKP